MDETITIPPPMADSRKQYLADTISTYSKGLLSFIRRKVAQTADAEDILQDVFYQFVTAVAPVEQVRAWLFTVARNKIKDRQRKKRPGLFSDLFPDSGEQGPEALLLDESGDPETAFLREVFWEEMDAALAALPAEQREVYVLHELDGLSFKEISARTGVPVNTLLSRKRYAVRQLREKLQDLYDEFIE